MHHQWPDEPKARIVSIRVEDEPPVFVGDDGEAEQAGVARNNILADRMLREMLGCDDLNPASLHVGLTDDAPDAAVMVDVRVAVDNRDDRLFTQTGRHELTDAATVRVGDESRV